MTAEKQPRQHRPAILSNPNSDRIREVAALVGRSARRRSGRVLVEGPQAVREALRFCGKDLLDVYISQTYWERDPEMVREAKAATKWVHLVTDEVSKAISTDSQGIAAVVKDFRTDGLPKINWSFIVVLAQTQDPGNAGTMIRIADAAGADAVFICSGSVDVTSPKVVRASAGSVFHLPSIVNVGLPEVLEWAKSRGMQLLAADGNGSLDLFDAADCIGEVDLAEPTAWIFGNEAHGFAQLDTSEIEEFVSIPLGGHAESLNVSAAAAVCLFASAKARRFQNL
ncbi:RNA methyltransferase [Gleimia sp. 6138-11-ORH1]|uniref:TrmH family RNA methyltransferase n=1 Tax=Gleimia sp. 6138-11-ORH1 TaxID=2973937 RepID=UPI00216838DE|nr:RNA methyltransferase [Gleimia sp. 6138-11-ORH1]MCS4484520.1 RNA methyltransferase [Gleimia sp. 6138-11-ORH1]